MTAVIFRYCLTLAFRGEKDMKKEVMEEIKKELDEADFTKKDTEMDLPELQVVSFAWGGIASVVCR